jgi:hypothetical protein
VPLITQGLLPDLKPASSKEAAVLLKRNQRFSEWTQSVELAAFLEQELSDNRIFGQADRAVISV